MEFNARRLAIFMEHGGRRGRKADPLYGAKLSWRDDEAAPIRLRLRQILIWDFPARSFGWGPLAVLAVPTPDYCTLR
jgi:hypothetical protein